MDPATLAMMYAANVGINALGGKRGSNLWKDSFKDTTTQALTMQLTGGFKQGNQFGKVPPVGNDLMLNITDQSTNKLGNKVSEELLQATVDKGSTSIGDQAVETFIKHNPPKEEIAETFMERFKKKPWETTTDIFKKDVEYYGPNGLIKKTRETDPVKVGLGSLGAGAAAYGLGLFDPEPPKDPKYPGYNKFYAQDPGQFMPYDDPNIAPVDYSKYPEKPYSGIKTGGIISLQEGGPASYKNMLQTDYGYERDYLDNLEMNEGPGALKELYDSLQLKGSAKGGGIMKLMSGGQTLSPQELFNKVMMEGYRPTPEEQQLINQYLQSQSGQKKGGIMKLVRGGKASNEPVKSPSEYDDERGLPPPGRSQSQPQPPQQPMPGSQREMGPKAPGGDMTPEEWRKKLQEQLEYMSSIRVKSGDLIHKLPHKTKQNENNPKNYKRTSGKLVVDNKGKGNEEKDTMLAQLADGEFVTKSKAVRGAGIALGANPKNKKQQRDLGAKFFYKQMAEFDKLAKRMAS